MARARILQSLFRSYTLPRMKVFISADIEGIAGITSWDEADPKRASYRPFQERTTAEVQAA